MLLALSGSNINPIAQFLTVLVIFIGVLALTYFSTRWVAGYQKNKMLSGNINVLETFKIAQNKYVQIIRIGDKIFAVAISKDQVTLLGEINEESLVIEEQTMATPGADFKSILEAAKKFTKKK
ncbi:MAG: flagellar biosynthetic protein FliO [Lachnospiraceae bacterium]|nr:flagellar biosynthetic protein FliO [Lachnospiraceae bacterium]